MVLLPCYTAIEVNMGRTSTTWESGSTWHSGETTSIRVPISLKNQILDYARSVDFKLVNDQSQNIPDSGDFLQIIDRYIAWRTKNYRSTLRSAKPDITARTWDELRKLQDLLRKSPELLQD
ncbi:hypothetical protein [Nostoc sp. ChiVER01]|uniref:hypothetical protein n=1 Tax=Nostoc sp. ChiVER01 TaxID=3075382 RepID=UPI002AD1D164|nr:hypothetical protein [Nostoc sp. ChiVER01]MDZ8227027.1 hypothetical protein [Nostoc sp. ChiVER01]